MTPPPKVTLPGDRLLQREWLAEQLRLSGLRWRTDNTRVAATLWWYSTSTLLLTEPLRGWFAGQPGDPRPEALRLELDGSGRPRSVTIAEPMPEGRVFAEALRELLTSCVEGLADVAELRPRPLWSLATDSLAGVLLRAGREVDAVPAACVSAERLVFEVGAPMPAPRWVEVEVPDGRDGLFPTPPPGAPDAMRLVRRGSCCLIYQAPGQDKCASCPRQAPHRRAVRQELAASRLAGQR